MKKRLGVLALTLSALVISAACASSTASTKPWQPDPGGHDDTSGALNVNWARAGQPTTELAAIPLANATAVPAARRASR
jgi:hypothetical protein